MTHRAEQAPHLRERCAARLLDVGERIPIVGERVRELAPDRADLEDHDADGMGDDVVELARDPGALLCHRDARSRLALTLGVECTFLRRVGLGGPLAQGEPGEPARSRTGRG